MRPQQNRRMRSRGGGGNNSNNNNNNNSGNRKGPNPLTRSYESNGPDVKIRGTAQQIAEKYTTLARDSHSSGDRVMAENYLQHAEHYNRIIAAAQAQLPNQQPQRRDEDDDEDEDRDMQPGFGGGEQPSQPSQPSQSFNGNGAHPRQEPRQEQRNERGERAERGDRNERGEHPRHNQPRGEQAPQPVIEGTPAEVALEQGEFEPRSGEVQQAGPAQEAADGDQPPRRARRPRRPRNRTEGEGDSQPADDPVPAA